MYAKLFSSIIHSTIWREGMPTKILWITMLAMADKDGMVQASIPGLADAARISVTECEEGLQRLQEPDPYSRTKDNEGRRILAVDGGWALLNYPKYRDLKSEEEKREKNRVKVANWRQKQKASVTDSVTKCNKSDSVLPPTDAYTEVLKEVPPKPPKGGRGKVLGDYSPEFEEAAATWSALFRETRPFQDTMAAENVHVASGPGPRSSSWEAWKKLRTYRVNGSGLVLDSDLLEVVHGFAAAKIQRARDGMDLNLPMFATLLNKPQLLDALVHVVKKRTGHLEVQA